MNTAKDQAQQIVSIDNVAPLCRIASQSFFSTSGLRFRMDDPEPVKNSRSRTLNITRDEFEHAYYDPIRDIVGARSSYVGLEIAGRKFRGARIEEADAVIALADQNVSLTEKPQAALTSSQYLGKDGVLIRLGSSWSQANMKLQPHLRSN